MELTFAALTAEHWQDFEKLFGDNGACGGCWCMLWRMTRAEHDENKGENNKRAMRDIVNSGPAPGILAYNQRNVIGWCALAPRENYPALKRSRVMKPLDDNPVWSVACLFIDKSFRRKGVSVELLKAAIDHVRKNGGHIVEGYPVEPKKPKMPDVFAWTGTASAFLKAGFVERGRGSETRPIMRFEIE